MLHGESHWKCVAWTGLQLVPDVPGCDATVLLLFSLLHDTQRLHEGHDPEHGARAAAFARRLHAADLFVLPSDRLELLCYTCAHHTSGGVTAEPTIGASWDADRLNLWRVGIRPNAKWLSTATAKRAESIAAESDSRGSEKSGMRSLTATLRSQAGVLRLALDGH
jgi:uncharacterized protein